MSGQPSKPLDICLGSDKPTKSTPSSDERKRKRQYEEGLVDVTSWKLLRPGMILLKGFVKPEEQVSMVRMCRHLGVGPGGFYNPSYSNGAKLKLWMMCLGKNWDQNSSSYGDTRPFDGAQPPAIPEEFSKVVYDALQASNGFLKQQASGNSATAEIPPITPDICIVNFYNDAGRLGLHQDKDESDTSITQGLPVISISLGDTAEFLYGDTRDKGKASKVHLESGDVLIFGGSSRLVYHGISSVKPHTAPSWLRKETNLQPGRLNLTFRQH